MLRIQLGVRVPKSAEEKMKRLRWPPRFKTEKRKEVT